MEHSNHQATRARYVVILFAVTLAVVTYMQRHAISLAAPASVFGRRGSCG